MKKITLGSSVLLHRTLHLSCFPSAEAGPAAIIDVSRDCWSEIAETAKALIDGEDRCAWAGVRKGKRQSVLVLSDWVPNPKWVEGFYCPISWVQWNGGAIPASDADVIIVWRPLQSLPRMTLARATARLIASAFGGGAVYDARGLQETLKKSEARHV
ncbi:hypothetical protein [Horticoccus sp. 23ND18S-11]|uniref:hypothetical protein n=1 Tax=Horticoccus sp. 23ND18S-11 TaxID=3391832 RepID=UPI0039C9059A